MKEFFTKNYIFNDSKHALKMNFFAKKSSKKVNNFLNETKIKKSIKNKSKKTSSNMKVF